MRLVRMLNTTMLLSLSSSVVLAALFICFFPLAESQHTLPGPDGGSKEYKLSQFFE